MKFKNSDHEAIEYITKKLSEIKITLSPHNEDGRINSALDEQEIINQIAMNNELNDFFNKRGIKLIIPKIRHWFDLALETDNKLIPINIKTTYIVKGRSDNLNSKLGVYFALTGKAPEFDNQINWSKYFMELKQNMQPNDEDYYFIVINKNDTSDLFWNSLKQLKSLTPNGNNLPFQCVWSDNRQKIERTFEQAKKFILDNFAESIKKRAQIEHDFIEYFEQNIDN